MSKYMYDFVVPCICKGYAKITIPADSYEEAKEVLTQDDSFRRTELELPEVFDVVKPKWDKSKLDCVFEKAEGGWYRPVENER